MQTTEKNKGKQWKSKVSPKANKENIDKDVLINIGLMVWNEKENILKTKRDKKLVLRVNPLITYTPLEDEAKEKWQVFHRNLYDPEQPYHILYEDACKADYLPGPSRELFSLNRYQEEVQRDYKRITLYLVTDSDYKKSLGETSESDDDDNIDDKKNMKVFPFQTNESNRENAACKRPSNSSIDLADDVPTRRDPDLAYLVHQPVVVLIHSLMLCLQSSSSHLLLSNIHALLS